jgi:hypothetical protein
MTLDPVEYLCAAMDVTKRLLDWHDRWERDRWLGPEVEEALRAEWKRLSDEANLLMATPVEGEAWTGP